jgi:hypothetical protein
MNAQEADTVNEYHHGVVDRAPSMPYPRLGVYQPPINRYYFHVGLPLRDIIEVWQETALAQPTSLAQYCIDNLDNPSGCQPYIVLPSNVDPVTNEPKKWRRLYVGYQATNRDIIQRILNFYKHNTIRRCMRGFLYWGGFTHQTDINGFSSLGPLRADMTLMNYRDDIAIE